MTYLDKSHKREVYTKRGRIVHIQTILKSETYLSLIRLNNRFLWKHFLNLVGKMNKRIFMFYIFLIEDNRNTRLNC